MMHLLLVSTIGIATACGRTAEGVKQDTKDAAEATSEAVSRAEASMDASTQTVRVKMALMADTTIDASDVNVDTSNDMKTVTLNGSVKSEAQRARAETLAREKAPDYTVVNNLIIK